MSRVGAADTLIRSPVEYGAAEYDNKQGVVLSAERIVLKGDKIWFRFNLLNNTGKVLVIDKVQMHLRLEDGQVVAREGGVFNKHPKPEVVMAGVSQQFAIEFAMGKDPVPVALILDHGVIVDGKSLPLPPYKTAPATKEEQQQEDSNW